ncbi:hypothetical protein P12x_004668 [Tundrisphaera lichenicola]|uniref:hypothetical protein n=1 Tax=Tundrisphaera lichenicola TaxID=2029860 RepID=UPI003EBB9BA0
MDRFRVWPLLMMIAGALSGSVAHASPLWVRIVVQDSMQGRIIDIPADARVSSYFVTSASSLVPRGVSIPASIPEPNPTPYQPETKFSVPMRIGFAVPTPSEVADPRNWGWHSNSHPEDVTLTGTAQGAYGWGGAPFNAHVGLSGTFLEGSVTPYRDANEPLPSELLDLIKHPERVSLGASSTGRPYQQRVEVGFSLSPPVATPEPTVLTAFGVLLGGCLIRHRRHGRPLSARLCVMPPRREGR